MPKIVNRRKPEVKAEPVAARAEPGGEDLPGALLGALARQNAELIGQVKALVEAQGRGKTVSATVERGADGRIERINMRVMAQVK